MKPIALIRASAPAAFLGLLKDAGAPIERLWERARLPRGALQEPERLVPLQSVIRFAEDAAASLASAELGLRVAEREGIESVGGFGAAIRSAPTLQRAIETARDLVCMHDSGARYWLVLEGDSAKLCRRIRDQGDDFRQADLFTIGLLVKLVRSVAGPDWQPSRATLQSAGTTNLGTSELLCEAAVTSAQPMTSISFPRSFLVRPLAPRSKQPSPEADWRCSRPPSDFLASFRIVVESLLELGQPDIACAARTGGTSVRSLQRRLAEEGTSYSDVIGEVRFGMATRLLAEPGIKIIEVAFALGYSDPAHFTRAFRRWTSVSPVEYRRGLADSPAPLVASQGRAS